MDNFCIENKGLEKMMSDFDIALRTVFPKMDAKNSDEATITLKIDVRRNEKTIQNSTFPGQYRSAFIPIVNFKITTKITVDDSKSGIGDYRYEELVQRDNGEYAVVRIPEYGEQTEMEL